VHCGVNKPELGKLACKKCGEKRNSVLRKSNLKVKMEAFEAYGGAVCSCPNCPERIRPRIEFLTLNHVGGGGTKHRKSIGGKRAVGGGVSLAGIETYRWVRRKGYPPGFNVLCWNCQWGTHINKGVCPHQENK
jgi:hypothetical protein